MDIIPVVDIRNGVVVHAVGGQRDQYAPVRSQLTPSCDPSVILRTFKNEFGFERSYLADLDGIQTGRRNHCVIAELTQLPGSLMVDAGVRGQQDVEELLDLGVDQVVIALETLPDLQTASEIASSFGSDKLVISLDLNGGQIQTTASGDCAASPEDVAASLIEAGYQNMIVLDIASVGTHSGIPTLGLCTAIRNHFPEVSVITGGGVSSVSDLQPAHDAGVAGVLVASALHNGALSKQDLAEFR